MFKIQIATISSLITFFDVFVRITASTHWIVTENGRIQQQLDSVYRLKRPYDLVSFLEQEERAQNVVDLYEDLVKRKRTIDQQWSSLDTASELANNLYSTDPDCLLAVKPLSDQQLYASVFDTASEEVNLKVLHVQEITEDVDLDCSKIVPLDFSMATFPHLQVLSQPWNFTWVKEGDIEIPLTLGQIYVGLMKNKTSWYLYNMASLYWRKVGDSQRALDCTKRAVHFAHREYKAAPLLNLGVMLQRAHCTAEAAILLHSCIDHAPYKALGHLALGNVYAILGDYNRSVACFDNVLALKPDWNPVRRLKHAVVCHKKLGESLFQFHRFLQDLLSQLNEYHGVQERWLKNQEELIKHQDPLHDPFTSSFSGSCIPELGATSSHLTCKLTTEPMRLFPLHSHLDIILSLQVLLKNVESQARKISEQLTWSLSSPGVESFKNKVNDIDEDEDLEVVIEESKEIKKTTDLNAEDKSNFTKLPS